MTEREAIASLKTLCNTCTMYPKCVNVKPECFQAIEMAISALEKQEKKQAKAKFNKRYNKFVYFCPVCGEVTGYYDYCPDCGQAIVYDNPEPYTEEEDAQI